MGGTKLQVIGKYYAVADNQRSNSESGLAVKIKKSVSVFPSRSGVLYTQSGRIPRSKSDNRGPHLWIGRICLLPPPLAFSPHPPLHRISELTEPCPPARQCLTYVLGLYLSSLRLLTVSHRSSTPSLLLAVVESFSPLTSNPHPPHLCVNLASEHHTRPLRILTAQSSCGSQSFLGSSRPSYHQCSRLPTMKPMPRTT